MTQARRWVGVHVTVQGGWRVGVIVVGVTVVGVTVVSVTVVGVTVVGVTGVTGRASIQRQWTTSLTKQ